MTNKQSYTLPTVWHRGLGGCLPPFLFKSICIEFVGPSVHELAVLRECTVIYDAGTPPDPTFFTLPANEYVPLLVIPWLLPRQDVTTSRAAPK